jgi:ABC-type multidrug transport system ATPase subunit
MSEQILKALTHLFAIISKQDGGVTEVEREFVMSYFNQELDRKRVAEYMDIYDKKAKYGKYARVRKTPRDSDRPSVVDSAVAAGIWKKFNKSLSQPQKVIVLFKMLELLMSSQQFTENRMGFVDTAADSFGVPREEYLLIKSFVVENDSHQVLDSENILVFDEEMPPEDSKKRFIDSGFLDGEIMFVRVKSVNLYFTKYTGNDEIFLNGQLIRKGSIKLFSHGSVFKTPRGAPLYYSDLVSNYSSDEEGVNLSFHVEDIGYKFESGDIGLRSVTVSESGGKLIGIMGASGAGKTTLLNVMAGLYAPSRGSVKINGYDVNTEKEMIKGVIGYISQDDLLIEDLTVFQNLYYNAKRCFRDLSEEDIVAKVDETLASLGLQHAKHIKVGSVLNKKISGGQRKRLNIALELIREPAVLFVDEPTSGLSSNDSENVIDLLKELSLKGKLIFVVIHQPSSDIYKMFDKMILMDTGGYQVFYGNPIEAISYFKTITHQVGSDRGQCPTCGNVNPELIFNIMEARVVNEYGEFTDIRKITPPEWNASYNEFHEEHIVAEVTEAPPQNLKIPSKFTQAKIFTVRDFLSKISNTQYMAINLLEAPLLGMLLALIVRYKNSQHHVAEYVFRYNDNIPAFILISVIVALFMGLTVSAEEIIRDRKIQKREAFLNLSRTSYLFSKITILFSLSLIQTFMFVLIGNFILGIEGLYMTYWVVLFTISCFANVLGLNISASFNSAVTVYILIPIILIPLMILSGAIFRFDQLNNAITKRGKVPIIADFAASRWAYEALIVEQFKGNMYETIFFETELKQRENRYKMDFLIPKMEEVLDRMLEYKVESKSLENADSVLNLLNNDMILLKGEFIKLAGDKKAFKEVQKALVKLKEEQGIDININSAESLLNSADFNQENAEKLRSLLMVFKGVYNFRFVEQGEIKDGIIYEIEGNPNVKHSVSELRNMFHNESLDDIVRNVIVSDKIIEYEGALVQLTDPIFNIPQGQHPFDYRAHFYAPQKYFLGGHYDTLWFNMSVIWLMTLILYIMLYFETLKKVLLYFSELSLFNKTK